MTGEEPGDYVLDPEIVLPDDDVGDSATTAQRLRERAAEINREASEATQIAIIRLRQLGLSVRDIAEMVGLSHQRVSQLLADADVADVLKQFAAGDHVLAPSLKGSHSRKAVRSK